MQIWSRLIGKCDLYNRITNRDFQSFRANNSGVTGQILLIIQLIWDLVPINTSCKFGLDLLGNEVSITLTRKKLMDARMDVWTVISMCVFSHTNFRYTRPKWQTRETYMCVSNVTTMELTLTNPRLVTQASNISMLSSLQTYTGMTDKLPQHKPRPVELKMKHLCHLQCKI